MSEPPQASARTAPFATLVRIAGTYCHAEADEEAYEGLKRLAQRENDEEMTRFKRELHTALRSLPNATRVELYYRVRYEDGSAVRFLRRLWRDLYPHEPVPVNFRATARSARTPGWPVR
jgi:hypothetical protein